MSRQKERKKEEKKKEKKKKEKKKKKRQSYFCHDNHTFVATIILFVSTKDVFCRDKHVFVATKIIITPPMILKNSFLHYSTQLQCAATAATVEMITTAAKG